MKTDKAVLEKGGNPWNWAFHDGFIKKKKPEHQLQGGKEVQSLFLHLSASFYIKEVAEPSSCGASWITWEKKPSPGRNLWQNCPSMVPCGSCHLWVTWVGADFGLDPWSHSLGPWFQPPHHQHPWHAVAGLCHALQDVCPSLTAAPAACRILRVATV